MAEKNEGKVFESAIQKSIPEHVWFKRLNDNAAGWSGGSNTRFASTNECDLLLYDTASFNLFCLELKSTKGTLFSFWRRDFEVRGKKKTFMIKKNQILGLEKWAKFHCVVCGFIFNFRSEGNHTYFVSIENFISYTRKLEKKSINQSDVIAMDGIEIDCRLLKTNYGYDIEKMLMEVREQKYAKQQ